MSRPDPGAQLVRQVDSLRAGRWVSVRRGADELVVGTPTALTRTKIRAFAVGAGMGLGLAGLLSGLLVTASWILAAAAVMYGLWWGRCEIRARSTWRQIKRNERGQQARWEREHPAPEPDHDAVGGQVWREQPQLPARQRALPPGTTGEVPEC